MPTRYTTNPQLFDDDYFQAQLERDRDLSMQLNKASVALQQGATRLEIELLLGSDPHLLDFVTGSIQNIDLPF